MKTKKVKHVCGPTCLALCKFAAPGAGFGQKRARPSLRGRTQREQEYMETLISCECMSCEWHSKGKRFRCLAAATECDHVEGRGLGGHNRDKSPLKGYCPGCHDWKHGIRRK